MRLAAGTSDADDVRHTPPTRLAAGAIAHEDSAHVERSSDLARSLFRARAGARRGSVAVRPALRAPACASPAVACLSGGLKLLEPALARRCAPSCCGGYLPHRNLRCAVSVEQSVGFLIGVGKLRVAETSEQREIADDFEQLRIGVGEFSGCAARAVAPGTR